METDQLFDAAASVGRQQAFALIATKCTAAQAQCLRQLRDAAIHTQLGLTWERFCEQHAGISRRYADALIARLEEFGETYFKLSQLARISPERYREIAAHITEDTIEIDGQALAFTPENAVRIRSGIQRLKTRLRDFETSPHHSIVEFHVRFDALIDDVSKCKGRALGHNELFAYRDFTSYAFKKWRSLSKAFEAMKPL
jgi:hypothetical protein